MNLSLGGPHQCDNFNVMLLKSLLGSKPNIPFSGDEACLHGIDASAQHPRPLFPFLSTRDTKRGMIFLLLHTTD